MKLEFLKTYTEIEITKDLKLYVGDVISFGISVYRISAISEERNMISLGFIWSEAKKEGKILSFEHILSSFINIIKDSTAIRLFRPLKNDTKKNTIDNAN